MSYRDDYTTTFFAIPFDKVSITSTAAYDLMTITGSTLGRTCVQKIRIAEISSAVASDQQVDVQIFRGTTAGSSLVGASITPQNLKGWASAPVANTTVTGIAAAVASTVNATLLFADGSDFGGDFLWQAADGPEEFELDLGQTLTIRVGQPAVTITVSGHVYIREMPKNK